MSPCRGVHVFSIIAATSLWLTCVVSATADDVVIADFERDDYAGWIATGDAFGESPSRGTLANQQPVEGFRGRGLVNTYRQGDATTGTLTSPEFEISCDWLVFLIGGGRHPAQTGIELIIDDKSVRTATGADSEALRWHSWNVGEFRGKTARLRIFDHATGGWGHINIDQIELADVPRSGPDQSRLEEYRKSPGYYREPHRLQFHFSPEINWMNDPNGLVFFQGEYHLFYQYNPFGNEWGHMSWGHAVSRDLVHWQHLPIALHEQDGVMIFSGCAVVDRQNSSGFGKDGAPPLVAVYTGHSPGRQTQNLAYSNDRGRTWTKFDGNPVLDIGRRDFRDPKVLWHQPTRRWVMVVALAAAKRVQFYGSGDLKMWTHLSDFGPAGAKDKPNWECPDLFELPVENEPGKTKWVLEADMGGGSIAGGSGGEYFVGEFDGTTFHTDQPAGDVNWVDYGRDFYAPVSWSDVPAADGRRIWIGWMNNWQTSLLPTDPWRGEMSIPRVLSLRRMGSDGYRLIQKPVRELEYLRGERVHEGPLNIEETHTATATGTALEVIAEFAVDRGTEFGLRVRTRADEQTVIGYNVRTQQVFVDRERSGRVDFHPQFAGRHAGPLPIENGRIRLHVFVDASSVEVFGNDGYTVITDRIFPSPESRSVELYSTGGPTKLVSLDVWELKSIWEHAARDRRSR